MTFERDVEIEKKFLVKGDFPKPVRSVRELSFYLPSAEGEEIRVQKREGAGSILEVKREKSRLSRERTRVEISENTFQLLLRFSGGRKNAIERVLHYLPEGHGGRRTTVREYFGRLKGLVRAEVSFGSEKEAELFEKPPWMGREITSKLLGRNRRLYALGRRAFLRELGKF